MTFGSRRRFLWELGGGIAGLALCDLLKQDQLLASSIPTDSPFLPKKTHFPPKAKAVISLFMNGGTSHLDSFDPKPELTRRHLEAPPTQPQHPDLLPQSRDVFEESVFLQEVRPIGH